MVLGEGMILIRRCSGKKPQEKSHGKKSQKKSRRIKGHRPKKKVDIYIFIYLFIYLFIDIYLFAQVMPVKVGSLYIAHSVT